MFYLIRLQYYKKTFIKKNVLWNNYTLFLLLAFFRSIKPLFRTIYPRFLTKSPPLIFIN